MFAIVMAGGSGPGCGRSRGGSRSKQLLALTGRPASCSRPWQGSATC